MSAVHAMSNRQTPPISARLPHKEAKGVVNGGIQLKSSNNSRTSSLKKKAPLTSRIRTREGGERNKECSIEYKDYGEKCNYYAEQKVYMLNYLKSKYRQQEDLSMKTPVYFTKKSHQILQKAKAKPSNVESITQSLTQQVKFQPQPKKPKEDIPNTARQKDNSNISHIISTKRSSHDVQTMSSRRTSAWVNNQQEWFKGVKKKINDLLIVKNETEEKKYTQLTKAPITKRHHSTMMNTSSHSNSKLKKELNKKEMELTFTPRTNRSYRIRPKYLPEACPDHSLNRHVSAKMVKRDMKKIKNKSFEVVDYKAKQKMRIERKEISDHWTGELFKMNSDRSSLKKAQKEPSYKININDKGAWNENCINSVKMTERTKDILLSLLS